MLFVRNAVIEEAPDNERERERRNGVAQHHLRPDRPDKETQVARVAKQAVHAVRDQSVTVVAASPDEVREGHPGRHDRRLPHDLPDRDHRDPQQGDPTKLLCPREEPSLAQVLQVRERHGYQVLLGYEERPEGDVFSPVEPHCQHVLGAVEKDYRQCHQRQVRPSHVHHSHYPPVGPVNSHFLSFEISPFSQMCKYQR